MEIEFLHIIHPWCANEDVARVMVSTPEISRFVAEPIAQSYVHFRRARKQKPRTRAQSTSKIAKLVLESGSRRTSN